MTSLDWQKSSYSAQASNCIELAHNPRGETIYLRESDEPSTVLMTTPSKLAALLMALRSDSHALR